MRSLRSPLALGAMIFALSCPTLANAFCGFYVSGADAKLFNNATQVALMREGQRTVLSMQNNYQGPPENFAMVVPVPVVLQKENVKTLPREIFAHLDQLASPRLVEYWEEDPCAQPVMYEAMQKSMAMAAPPSMNAAPSRADLGVKIEAQFTVGEYEIVVLSAKDSSGLDTWLKQEKYKIPDGAEPYLRPYVQQGMKFFVAKVDVKKVTFKDGQAMLSPLRVHYDAEKFSLPVRLGLMNANGPQDLIVHVLAQHQRYDVANFPNVTIPTNIDVDEKSKERFGEFYAALLDRTLEKNPKAVVTEYAWESSNCDPCPGPTLSPADLATLGADALGGKSADNAPPTQKPTMVAPNRPAPRPAMPGTPSSPSPASPSPTPPTMGPFFGAGSSFVISRLHARYTKESLGDDLVFKAADPIVGGREFMSAAPGSNNRLEEGASKSSINNFQGRYAIRHPWTGPVACEKPVRGRWGGPPGGVQPKPQAAQNTAFAQRGKLELASFVKKDVPEIGLKCTSPLMLAATPATGGDGGSGANGSTSATPAASGSAGAAGKSGGCNAAPQNAASGAGGFALVAAGLALFARRRRSATRGAR